MINFCSPEIIRKPLVFQEDGSQFPQSSNSLNIKREIWRLSLRTIYSKQANTWSKPTINTLEHSNSSLVDFKKIVLNKPKSRSPTKPSPTKPSLIQIDHALLFDLAHKQCNGIIKGWLHCLTPESIWKISCQ